MNQHTCWSDPQLPEEIAHHGFPGAGGHCRVCGCTLYYASDILDHECKGCVGWGHRTAHYLHSKRERT